MGYGGSGGHRGEGVNFEGERLLTSGHQDGDVDLVRLVPVLLAFL